ncbi:MAG TPA: FAD-dependent oxidoreductase [Cytophagales bacterium]
MPSLLTRRTFFGKCAALLAASAVPGFGVGGCGPGRTAAVPGKIMGASAAAGHKLRGEHALFAQPPAAVHSCEYVIVGGGVAGLSAARRLKAGGVASFCVLELEEQAGGNASSGHNGRTAYPWGAHYLPLPNPDQTELLGFLRECGAVTGFDAAGLPVYNDYYLCFDPKERLYLNGYWQDGLIPHFGVPGADSDQIRAFLERMQTFRTARGTDGKYAFQLPVDASSADEQYRSLDRITMHAYLQSQGFTSPYLVWYVDYCCRDDYGTTVHDTSAWAGIHYFAARRGVAANAEGNAVLTWPEGNGWLVTQLARHAAGNLKTGCLVYAVTPAAGAVHVDYLDVRSGKTGRVTAGKCIVAAPQLVAGRLLKGVPNPAGAAPSPFTYSPWMVANLTLSPFPDRQGSPLSWDNVVYGGASLGYVNARHQHLRSGRGTEPEVVTYYLPLSHTDPRTARTEALARTHAEWVALITADLSGAHPGLEKYLQRVDVWLWGHGMVRPVPGFVWSEARRQAAAPVAGRVFFAHSDLSGISLFEEACYHGTRAAQAAMGTQ